MKGLPRSQARGATAGAQIIKQTISFAALALAVADGAPGFGSVVIGDLAEGNLLFLGAVSYVKLTTADSDVIATFSGNYAIGSAPDANGTLAGSEVDIIPSTAVSAAVAGVSALTRGVSATATTGTILDNTDGSLELNLNVLIADASISGPGSFTVDGFVVISYIVMGDD